MRNLIGGLGVFLLLAGVTGSAWAQNRVGHLNNFELEPTVSPLPDNVEILRLENGVDVVLMPNPAQPMVGIYTQVKVGSAWEDYQTSGMSHMLEHLLFNGSEKYTQDELYDLADLSGAYNNANTTRFFTNYMMVIPATGIETGMDLQSQMLFHSLIPVEKFAKEKGIVTGEIVQSRDWPGAYTESLLEQAMYDGSSLELPTLGTKSTIEHMSRDGVYAFYRKWYVPNNMVVTVAGNFERENTLKLLREYYGAAPPGAVDRSGLKPARLIEETRSISRRGGDERVLSLSFEAPSYNMHEFFPFLVLTRMLDLEGSGILTAALEEIDAAERPELGVWWEPATGFGRLTLQFTLKKGTDASSLYGLVQDAFATALENGLSAEDVLGIVRMRRTHTLLEREQLRMTGIYIAEPLVEGGLDFFVSYLDRLTEVTADEVGHALTNWLVDAPCLAVVIEPANDSAGDTGPVVGEPDKNASKVAPLQVDRSELENGAVLVSQTNPGSPLMAIHLAVRGRAVIDRDNAAAGALDLVHRLLSEGASGCDKACLASRIRSLGAVVKTTDDDRIPMDNYYTNGRFSFIRIEVAASHAAEALAMLTEQLQFAAFTESDFDRVKAERLVALGRGRKSARHTANGLLAEGLYGDHPLVMPPEGSVESLATLTFNQVRQVYRKAFSPDNLVFAVVGPMTHEELKDIITKELPGRGRPTPPLSPLPVTTAADTLTAPLGGQMGAIRLGSILEIAPDDATALALTVSIMSARMGMDLREKRGLSYSVGASLAANGHRAEFTAWINPQRERFDEGRTALREFVAAFDASSITQEELDKTRAARGGRLMMRRLSSMGQAYYLAMAELNHDIDGYLQAMSAYDHLQLVDLQRVAQTYLTTMKLVEVTVD